MADWYTQNQNRYSYDPSAEREKYFEKVRLRNDPRASGGVAEEATDAASDAVEKSEWDKLGEKMGSEQIQQGGSLANTAGGAMMMSGNPYLMAGGLGLTVLAQGEQNRRAEKERQRVDYNNRVAERQKMMQQLASLEIK